MTRRNADLAVLLAIAFTARVAAFMTQTYVVFRDETFQYFEQGHRLAFGSGVVPWEYRDGIRSMLLPAAIAGIMRLTSLIGDDPLLYVRIVRGLCSALSLVVVVVGYRMAERYGRWAALLTGGLCAIWFDLIYFAPSVMTEVIAAHCGLLALWLNQQGRARWAGALLGLALCLRFQYGPALAAAVLWQVRLDWARWRALAIGGVPVVLAIGGVLDWVSWGAPFQSIWLNVLRNTFQGVSAAMGRESGLFYPAYLWVAFWPLPVLALAVIVGARSFPALAIAAGVTLILHTAIPHKEVRFVYLALAAGPILIGLGLARAIEAWPNLRRIAPIGASVALLLLSWRLATVAPLDARWSFERANVQAFLAAHDQPGLCGLGVKDIAIFDTGGYTYLHREVPIYFQDFDPALELPGSSIRLRLAVRLGGQDVSQFPGAALDAVGGLYNYLIAEQGNAGASYAPLACFTDQTRGEAAPLCLHRRPGGCS